MRHSSGFSIRLLFLVLLTVLLGVVPAQAGGIAPDLDQDVQSDPLSLVRRRVIVQYSRPDVDGALLAASFGGAHVTDLPLIQGAVMLIPQLNLRLLVAHPAVKWVSPDRKLYRESQLDYDAQSVGADEVWASRSLRGSGVGIAVLDSGVYSGGGDFVSRQTGLNRLVGWRDLVNGSPTPYDDNGHGTHVAGIALASGYSSAGRITGTAPEAALIGVKVLAGDGSGQVSTVIQGLTWCLDNRWLYGIRVANLSLGHRPGESRLTDPLCVAVRNVVREGLVVVCSAGNKGKDSSGKTAYGGISSPGNEPAAITVGALNTFQTDGRADDTVCTYSSRGPTYLDHEVKPDLLAPGNRILSVRAPGSLLDITYPQNRYDADPRTSDVVEHYRLSGTSMAAPQVAGTIALVLQANPGLAANAVKAILMYTAEKLSLTDSAGQPLSQGISWYTQGAGSLNAVGAVEAACKIDPSVPVGQAWLTTALSGQSHIKNHTFSWHCAVVWGRSIYTGPGLLGSYQPAWGPASLWGDQSTWGQQVTWGDVEEPPDQPGEPPPDQVTWGEASIWGDQTAWGDQATWGEATVLTQGE